MMVMMMMHGAKKLLQEPDMTENVVLHRVKERPVMDKES